MNAVNEAALVSVLCAEIPDLVAAYVFGSEAAGTAVAESDIDIAVLASRPLLPSRRFEVQAQLGAVVGRDVDLVDLRAATTVLRLQVVGHGRLLFEADAVIRETFEDMAFSAYASLNEARRGIIDDARARGRIHA